MNKLVDYGCAQGDKFDFELDMDAGNFTISKNGELLAELTTSGDLKGKKIRPSLELYYANNTKIEIVSGGDEEEE